jgi:hypothetical protein
MALAGRRRRRRRPWWLLFAALLTLVVMLVNAAVSARSKGPSRRLAEMAYLDQVRPFVERSTEQGAELRQVRNDAAKLGRAGVSRRLDRVTADADGALRGVHATSPPQTLLTAHSLLVATLALRAEAAHVVQTALVQALGTDPPGPVINALVDAGADMAAADRSYRVFVNGLPKAPDVMAPSQWVEDVNHWGQPELTVFVTSLRSSSALAPVHDVAVILFTTDPVPVGTDAGSSVLPLTKNLKLQIVVGNAGNEAEKHATVTASLTPAAGSPGQAQSVRDFADLAPGQRQVVQLGGLRLDPNARYTLSVKITPVTGETSVADNEKTMAIFVRG